MERRPLTTEADDDTPEVAPQKPRTPIEVMKDWLADRQRMLVEREDDEEDDDDEEEALEAKKKSRISRALKGLFRKNVEKETVEHEPVAVPERSILGGVISVEAPEPVKNPEPLESTVPTAARTEVSPDEMPAGAEAAVPTAESAASSAAPVAESTPSVTPETSTPEDEEETDETPAAASGSGGAGSGRPPAGATSGDGGATERSSSTPDTVVVHERTTVERHPVTEEHHHHHRRAALGALIIAERIDSHRNKKRKAEIKEVKQTQAKASEQAEARIAAVEHHAKKIEQAPTPAAERPAQPLYVRHEMPSAPKPERPAATERPQSIGAVLEQSPVRPEVPEAKRSAPSIADLERRSRIEQPAIDEHDDIIVAAEKLATKAEEKQIAHEVYDERWHEVKDPKTAGSKTSLTVDDDAPVSLPSAIADRASTTAPHATMVNPSASTSGLPTPDPKRNPAVSGLWAALVIGVIVALIVIMT